MFWIDGRAIPYHRAMRPTEHKRKTCQRYNVPGDAHALTFSCFRRQAFLSRDRTRMWFLSALADARSDLAFDVWAYVVMPEHVHLVIFPRHDDYCISTILSSVKRPVARQAVHFVTQRAPRFLAAMCDAQPSGRVQYRFWQRGGGYDRNLTRDSTVHRAIDYVHANPVRRGLVDLPEQWKWSSAAYYLGARDVPFIPDLATLPPRDEFTRT